MKKFKLEKKHKKIITVAVLLSLIVSITATLVLNFSNKKIDITISEIETLSKDVRNKYKNRPNYWGLDTSAVVESGTYENIKNGKITSYLGKEVVVGFGFDGDKAMPTSQSFDIAYINLNKKECVSLLSYDLSEAFLVGLLEIHIDNQKEVVSFAWGDKNSLPISTNMAKRYCEKQNNILWTFK